MSFHRNTAGSEYDYLTRAGWCNGLHRPQPHRAGQLLHREGRDPRTLSIGSTTYSVIALTPLSNTTLESLQSAGSETDQARLAIRDPTGARNRT